MTRGKVIDLEFATADADGRRYAYRDGEPRQRANLDCLHEPERDALRDAFRQIYDLNKYEDDRRSYNNQARWTAPALRDLEIIGDHTSSVTIPPPSPRALSRRSSIGPIILRRSRI